MRTTPQREKFSGRRPRVRSPSPPGPRQRGALFFEIEMPASGDDAQDLEVVHASVAILGTLEPAVSIGSTPRGILVEVTAPAIHYSQSAWDGEGDARRSTSGRSASALALAWMRVAIFWLSQSHERRGRRSSAERHRRGRRMAALPRSARPRAPHCAEARTHARATPATLRPQENIPATVQVGVIGVEPTPACFSFIDPCCSIR